MSDPANLYQFGPFRLDVRERRLLRGNVAIPVRSKVFDTLCLLVRNAGRLLTKEELLQAVWPDAVVEENNLNHNISVLRKALGESATGQSYIETVPRVGYRFVAPVEAVAAAGSPRAAATVEIRAVAGPRRQEIRFCTAPDNVRVAYATVGRGHPLVKAANWLNHLEFEWDSPIWAHWIEALKANHLLVRYDERANGLSDWDAPDVSFEAWVSDLEAVVDAVGVNKFALLGISQGGAVAIAYASRHPERVSHLVLYGAYARGWDNRGNPHEVEARRALLTLMRLGWGQKNPAFWQLWTHRFMPHGRPEHVRWFNDLQRISATPENAARIADECSRIDVTHLLRALRVPTIVLHSQHDQAVPFQEGRLLAAEIPGASFVPLPSTNHLVLADEPAWQVLLDELGSFLGWKMAAGAALRRAG